MTQKARSPIAIRILRDNPRAAWGALAALGIVSGLLSALTYSNGHGYVPLKWPVEGRLLRLLIGFSPGLWFGMLIGGCLLALGRTGPVRALAFAVLVAAAWWAGVYGGVVVFDALDACRSCPILESIVTFFGMPPKVFAVVSIGIAWGSVNALGVVAAGAILFPASRRLGHMVLMVAAGAAAGMLLGLYADRDLWGFVRGGPELFCAWQGAVAAVLGHAVFIAKPKVRSG